MVEKNKSYRIYELLKTYYFHWRNEASSYEKLLGYCMQPQEAILLHCLVLLEKPEVIFESGTCMGWSASWMALASSAPVFTYDIELRSRIFDEGFNAIIGSFAANIKTEIIKWQGHKKLILIDGDHTKKGVLEDFYAIKDFVEPRDIIVLHDTVRERGVFRILNKIKLLYPEWQYNSINTVNGMVVIKCT